MWHVQLSWVVLLVCVAWSGDACWGQGRMASPANRVVTVVGEPNLRNGVRVEPLPVFIIELGGAKPTALAKDKGAERQRLIDDQTAFVAKVQALAAQLPPPQRDQVDVKYRYRNVLNGMAMSLPLDMVEKVRSLQPVVITPDFPVRSQLATDPGTRPIPITVLTTDDDRHRWTETIPLQNPAK